MHSNRNMFSHYIAILFFIKYFLILNTNGDPGVHNPSLLGRLWDIGCEFSGVVTRVRRSAPNPPPEEPNFEDPEELFKYLYPLADVKPGESLDGDGIGSERGNVGKHSISSWLEDLMELWHSECSHRRKKRSAERRQDYNKRGQWLFWDYIIMRNVKQRRRRCFET